jgi:hypothetical protein
MKIKNPIMEAATWILALSLILGTIPAKELIQVIPSSDTQTPKVIAHLPYDGFEKLANRPRSPVVTSIQHTTLELPSQLMRLYTSARSVADSPLANPILTQTYHNQGCFDFLRLLFRDAGLELSAVLASSSEESQPQNGDLIKIEASTYQGLPHWGLLLAGQVYHNWGTFRVDPLETFLFRFPLPGSRVHFFHPHFPLSPNRSFSLYR